jgi:transposase
LDQRFTFTPLHDDDFDFISRTHLQEAPVLHNNPVAFPPIPEVIDNTPGAAAIELQHHYERFTPAPRADLPDIVNSVSSRVESRRVYTSEHYQCNQEFRRKPDLNRHHNSVHLKKDTFRCRRSGYKRTVCGFPRRDKRDSHLKSMH